MKIVAFKDVVGKSQQEYGSLRPGGTVRQFIFNEEAPDGLNFKLFRSQFQPGEGAHTTPRHHHAFQQVRWAESGSVNYAPDKDIDEGDVAYFPLGAYYGPQHKDQGVTVTLQFGFGSEHQDGGVEGSRRRDEATARLSQRGTFEGGMYFETDPITGERRERDAVHALYEEMNAASGTVKFEVPPERYATPILMHTGAFEYVALSPGVEAKYLGSFYDHAGPHGDVKLSMIRLAAESTHTFGPDRAQVAWTKSPGLLVNGATYPELTCLYSPRDESLPVSSESGAELFVAELPRLDR